MSGDTFLTRRRLLEVLGVSGLGGIAGCGEQAGSPTTSGTRTPTAPSSKTGTTTSSTPSDAGETRGALEWGPLPGPPGGPVTFISVSRANPEWIYAAGRTAGIFASDDGGASWIQGFSGQHHRSRVWASPHDPETAFTKREVTENGGWKWHHPEWSSLDRYAPTAAPSISAGGATVARVFDMEWDPFDEDTIYASTNLGFHRSADGGQTWQDMELDIGTEIKGMKGRPIAVHPDRKGFVAVGILAGNDRVMLLESRDRGESWTTKTVLSKEHSADIRGLVFGRPELDRLYFTVEGRGLFKHHGGSTDRIDTGEPGLVFPEPAILGRSAGGGFLYFVAAPHHSHYPISNWWHDRRVYEYDTTQGVVDTIETPALPNVVRPHPTTGSTLYIGGNSWVHRSQDRGRTWEQLSNGFVDHYLSTVAVNPTQPGTVFPGSICSTGLSVSYDQGKTYEWKRSGLGPWHHGDFGEHYIMQIAARRDRAYATTGAGLLISDDNGAEWRMLENEFSGTGKYGEPFTHLHGLAVHPEDPETVFVGTGRGGAGGERDDVFEGAKLWKSTDGGATWQERTDGFPTHVDTTVQDIVVDPHRPEVVYAATNAVDYLAGGKKGGDGAGIYRSSNGGRSWSRVPTPFENVHSVSIDAEDPDLVYASAPTPETWDVSGAAYRSVDGGRSWERMLDYETRALLAHPSESGVLFAGSMKHTDYWDVLVSDDAGEHWGDGNLRIRTTLDPAGPDRRYDATELHSDYWGSSNGQIMWFALDDANSHLYAATNGVGLWRADTSTLFE